MFDFVKPLLYLYGTLIAVIAVVVGILIGRSL